VVSVGVGVSVRVDVGDGPGVGVSVSRDIAAVTISSVAGACSADAVVVLEGSKVGVWVPSSRKPPQALLTNNNNIYLVIFIRERIK
jgi:hypothetical protein